ncbi:MAG: hypothetical protein ACI4XF_04605 [Oscillospiraceae bacterium]
MRNTDTAFFREIDEREEDLFAKSGNIQYHDGEITQKYDYLSYTDSTFEYSDGFYRILRKAVKKVDNPPILFIILFYVCSAAFFLVALCTSDLSGEGFGFVLFSILIFAIATALLVIRIVKKNRVLKCIKQRENIYAVSLPIDGTRSFYDNDGDSSGMYYYIYSEPNLISVPKKIFDAAAPNKNLIGAVIDTRNEKIFYALYVI